MVSKRRMALIAVAAAFALMVAAVYFFYDPSTSRFFPRCPFLMATGMKCPGCGSQRAVHDLLNGDVAAAARHNAMMVAFIPVLAVYAAAEFRRTRAPRFYAALNAPAMVWTIFAVVMAWWIARNIFGL